MSVHVFGIDGQPLAPCHPARARELLKKKRAKVVAVNPYTIRLIVASEPQKPKNFVQDHA